MGTRKLVAAFVMVGILAPGCVAELDLQDGTEDEGIAASALTCTTGSGAYTPYRDGTSSTGTAAQYPWRGYNTTYPASVEDFRGYGTALPVTVECGDSKSRRSHLDVTAGCLTAVNVGSWTRGQIRSTSDGAFRSIAVGYTGTETAPVKWTDQSVQYRFYYTGTSGSGVNPGFKAFMRYRSEEDLYVASWRVDGVVQIQKKHCGQYTALKVLKAYGRPSTGVWHTMRFDAVGSRLDLYLDGTLVLSAVDDTFPWGTSGIRTDAMDGAFIDDWRVRSPT